MWRCEVCNGEMISRVRCVMTCVECGHLSIAKDFESEECSSSATNSLADKFRLHLTLHRFQNRLQAFAGKRSLNILEVGGGAGRLAKALQRRGHRLTVVDHGIHKTGNEEEEGGFQIKGV